MQVIRFLDEDSEYVEHIDESTPFFCIWTHDSHKDMKHLHSIELAIELKSPFILIREVGVEIPDKIRNNPRLVGVISNTFERIAEARTNPEILEDVINGWYRGLEEHKKEIGGEK